jgi:hypothetical protein
VILDRRSFLRAAVSAGLLLSGCALHHQAIRVVATEPAPDVMAEFWKEPEDPAGRDLFWGPWGEEHAPRAEGRFEFRSRKSTGYSRGFDVKDEKGIKWSAKVGDEAQSEVVASRLMWAIGYHQPPVYYVPHWTLSGETGWAGPREPARFRAHLKELDDEGDWDWHHSPFTGTQPWRGALVMMLLLNNSDLKPSQNTLYRLKEPRAGVGRWYVVRDLGLSLGESGAIYPKRNDIDQFEKEPFIVKQEGQRLQFGYSGRWKELFKGLTPADIRWTCERLNRLSPHQWEEAFRAGGYPPELAARFIRRFQQKVEQGLALQG